VVQGGQRWRRMIRPLPVAVLAQIWVPAQA
jgi:hypothetical protein